MAKARKKKTEVKETLGSEKKKQTSFEPLTVEASMDYTTDSSAPNNSRVRRNISATQNRTDRFKNIDDGVVPFNYATGQNYNKSSIDIRDTIILCQKCYWNFALFRNTIELMVELCCGKVHYQGGNDASRKFFKALFNKINLSNLQSKFFREYFRSGNVFLYRYETKIQDGDINKITQVFGSKKRTPKITLPARYIIINPADIQVNGNLSFNRGVYFKVLTEYELEAIRNPRTEEDREIYDSLDDATKKMIDKKNTAVLLKLDTTKIYAIFYMKQDYEPFAVPMGFPVLEDINAKMEMRKMDMALTRTLQQVVLLVTMGAEPDKGGINQENLKTMQEIFRNQSVSRTLIADYTTKAEFVIPQIADILDPKKYEVIDRDISTGLGNVLVGNEKFANAQAKISVFLAKLNEARHVFINDFLIQEIKRISKDIGFKVFPTPIFEDIALKDDVAKEKVITRLIELGILTADEGIKAIETGVLPTSEESQNNQKDYKTQRDNGLYNPLVGGSQGADGENGRPSGTKGIKQSSKNVSPMGAKGNYSVTKLTQNLSSASSLQANVETEMKKKHKIKKLNDLQLQAASEITKLIIINENPEDWNGKIKLYLAAPIDKNESRVKEITNIACEHQTDSYVASLLYHSRV
mgnify:CR=1 FL=1